MDALLSGSSELVWNMQRSFQTQPNDAHFALLVVFPPFHLIFSGRKERKRNKKKEIVKTLAHFFSHSIHTYVL
jgi:hypothetical protein